MSLNECVEIMVNAYQVIRRDDNCRALLC